MELLVIGFGLLVVGFLAGALVFRKNGAKMEAKAAELKALVLKADGVMRDHTEEVSDELRIKLENLQREIENRVRRVIN